MTRCATITFLTNRQEYDFDYDDDDDGMDDDGGDEENQYYRAKGEMSGRRKLTAALKDDDSEAALKAFRAIVDGQDDKGEW